MLRERECEPRDYGRADGVGRASEGRVGVEGRRDGRREAERGRGGEGEWWLWLGVMVALQMGQWAHSEGGSTNPRVVSLRVL